MVQLKWSNFVNYFMFFNVLKIDILCFFTVVKFTEIMLIFFSRVVFQGKVTTCVNFLDL